MKPNLIILDEEEDFQEWKALLEIIKKQAELDKKLRLLIVAVGTSGE